MFLPDPMDAHNRSPVRLKTTNRPLCEAGLDATVAAGEDVDYMFAQTSARATVGDARINLEGVSPITLSPQGDSTACGEARLEPDVIPVQCPDGPRSVHRRTPCR
jgi:hypothetical protein